MIFYPFILQYHQLVYEFTNIIGLFSWQITDYFHKDQETINEITHHLNYNVSEESRIDWIDELVKPMIDLMNQNNIIKN